ncbi:12322_t:CDS:2 [Gigaspora margarita]|uniref:12322_t:CDS:1 n=1 Tax=Gigaspora margarita TaxID=4874 RepID=A0ABN7URA0_GIGMA|nr:12322_t:CDS:2 [Gigaspora margarita]
MDKAGFMATLLDPRLKGMDMWPEEIQEQPIIELCREFQKFITIDVDSNQPQSNHETEIDNNLNPQITPPEPENTDAYLWWCLNQNNFQILTIAIQGVFHLKISASKLLGSFLDS